MNEPVEAMGAKELEREHCEASHNFYRDPERFYAVEREMCARLRERDAARHHAKFLETYEKKWTLSVVIQSVRNVGKSLTMMLDAARKDTE